MKSVSVPTQKETTQLTDEEEGGENMRRSSIDRICFETTMEQIQYLKVEISLLELYVKLKKFVTLQKTDIEECLNQLEILKNLNVKRLMLLKQPRVVVILKKLRRYVGNGWAARTALIREQADEIYLSYKNMFPIPQGMTFSKYYIELVAKFKEYTSNFTVEEYVNIFDEPEGLFNTEENYNLDVESGGDTDSMDSSDANENEQSPVSDESDNEKSNLPKIFRYLC